jgi:hypothetical protein
MTLEATTLTGSTTLQPLLTPDAGSAIAARLDPLLEATLTGTPVEQGAGLRTLDTVTGDRAMTDAAVADSRASGQCAIDVRFNPVIGPTNHAFIVTTDADSTNYFRGGPQANNTAINSSSSQGEDAAPYDAKLGVYGSIVTEYGAYRPNTVDWTTNPSGQQRVASLPGNCDAIERINYEPLSANSNSTVREALERAGYPDVSPVVWAPAWNTQLPLPR